MDLTHHSANHCLRDPWGTFHSDNLFARHDGRFLNYPSCTMKYVVSATCRIKQHSKTKASQILQAFNPSVSVESRPAKPMGTDAPNLCDPWRSATKYLYIFLIFHLLLCESKMGDYITVVNSLKYFCSGDLEWGTDWLILKWSWATRVWLSLYFKSTLAI